MEMIFKKYGLLGLAIAALITANYQILGINKSIAAMLIDQRDIKFKMTEIYIELKTDDIIEKQMLKDIEILKNRTPTPEDWYSLKAEVEKIKKH